MSILKQAVQTELDNMDLKYEYNKKGGFLAFFINIDNSIGSLRVIIQLMEERYLVYALINNRAPKSRFSAVSEFLHRVNFGLINGNFEMDYATGEVRYKSFVNVKESDISGAVIRDSILVPIMMFRKYGDGLLKIMTGTDTPESIIKSIE